MIEFFTENNILWGGLLACFIAQLLKIPTYLVVFKKLDLKRAWGAGGLPSSHSAFVTCAATMVFRQCGYASVEFALAAMFAIIVMYDATGVRREAGEHARLLNQLIFDLEKDNNIVLDKKLKEFLGHTPFEVVAGVVVGLATGILL